jgi:hypothetical protein
MVEKKSPKNSPHDDSNADQTLISTINQSLDKSLDEIDELNLQRLKNARAKAINNSPAKNRKWVSLSVAASVAALLLIPVVLNQDSGNSNIEPELEIVSQETPISAEEMDDIDMLMALEDTDA